MEAKFTRERWERLGKNCIRTNPGDDGIRGMGGLLIAELDYWNFSAEEANANACLLEAAPDMYKVLSETVHDSCVKSGCHAYNNGECMNGPGLCCAQKWLAVLKKARGES